MYTTTLLASLIFAFGAIEGAVAQNTVAWCRKYNTPQDTDCGLYGQRPYCCVFSDKDKFTYPDHLDKLTRMGSGKVCDNRVGALVDEDAYIYCRKDF